MVVTCWLEHCIWERREFRNYLNLCFLNLLSTVFFGFRPCLKKLIWRWSTNHNSYLQNRWCIYEKYICTHSSHSFICNIILWKHTWKLPPDRNFKQYSEDVYFSTHSTYYIQSNKADSWWCIHSWRCILLYTVQRVCMLGLWLYLIYMSSLSNSKHQNQGVLYMWVCVVRKLFINHLQWAIRSSMYIV